MWLLEIEATKCHRFSSFLLKIMLAGAVAASAANEKYVKVKYVVSYKEDTETDDSAIAETQHKSFAGEKVEEMKEY